MIYRCLVAPEPSRWTPPPRPSQDTPGRTRCPLFIVIIILFLIMIAMFNPIFASSVIQGVEETVGDMAVYRVGVSRCKHILMILWILLLTSSFVAASVWSGAMTSMGLMWVPFSWCWVHLTSDVRLFKCAVDLIWFMFIIQNLSWGLGGEGSESDLG